MKVGLVVPSYPNEKRVALLPEDIDNFPDELIVESGFGDSMGIPDSRYVEKGCLVKSREDVFKTCDTLFVLKLFQPCDYSYLRDGQMIVGWTHPTGSGAKFMADQAIPKNLKIVDLDNAYPKLHFGGRSVPLDFLPKNFLHKNSFYAGFSSTMHAFLSYGAYPDPSMRIAVLGNGNTSQGVFHFLSKFTDNIRMYYRKTIPEFKDELGSFDVIVNGIEVDVPDYHLITEADIAKTKRGCFFIDAAADAGNTIEGTRYTSIDKPMYERDGRYFYEVNNSPSLIYRTASHFLSKAFSDYIFKPGFERFVRVANTLSGGTLTNSY